MTRRLEIQVPMNRVEGDLQVRVELEDGVVRDAWCSGTMYRGFEKILVGRGALDGLVITPRVCGICSTGHLVAAAKALDAIAGVTPPPDAERVRNLALMTETVQSDVRHAFLMFAVDFVNPAYQGRPWFAEALRRWEPFRGETAVETLRESKQLLEVIAILAGQWPHSSFAVPGGVVSVPSAGELQQSRLLLARFRSWYERRVLGCTIDRWREIRSTNDLERWLGERDEHRTSDLGLFLEVARETGLDRIGGGHGNFISFGSLGYPAGTRLARTTSETHLVPPGFVRGARVHELDPRKISEDVSCSWYEDSDGARHPFQGETRPYACGEEGKKYSWAKAPRYDTLPAETSPLAEMLAAGHPFFTQLVAAKGASAFVRELARIVRPTSIIPAMETWLDETTGSDGFYTPPGPIEEGEGAGLMHATRGALGHWVRVQEGRISSYQIVTPTAWNASPRDDRGVRGPMEEALIGTPVADPMNPVALGHVVRSFDACLVCTVHTVVRGRGETGEAGSASLYRFRT